jgi:hypothetical protein
MMQSQITWIIARKYLPEKIAKSWRDLAHLGEFSGGDVTEDRTFLLRFRLQKDV